MATVPPVMPLESVNVPDKPVLIETAPEPALRAGLMVVLPAARVMEPLPAVEPPIVSGVVAV